MPTARDLLATAQLYTDEQIYILVKLPRNAVIAAAGVVAEIAEPFSALLVDKDEVTLLIPEDVWVDYERRLPGYEIAARRFRLITFDLALDLSVVGFMALIADALAQVNMSILPYAAYTRDHIFVSVDEFDLARHTLRQLQTQLASG